MNKRRHMLKLYLFELCLLWFVLRSSYSLACLPLSALPLRGWTGIIIIIIILSFNVANPIVISSITTNLIPKHHEQHHCHLSFVISRLQVTPGTTFTCRLSSFLMQSFSKRSRLWKGPCLQGKWVKKATNIFEIFEIFDLVNVLNQYHKEYLLLI